MLGTVGLGENIFTPELDRCFRASPGFVLMTTGSTWSLAGALGAGLLLRLGPGDADLDSGELQSK